MKKKIQRAFVEILAKKLVKTERELKVLKHNYKVTNKDRVHVLEQNRIQRVKLARVQGENKCLKERNKCLETFTQKAKDGFSVIYQYKKKEGYEDDGVYVKSITEQYPVAQNIETEEDAKQIVKIFEKYNKDSHVYYVIGSPEI